MHAPMLPGTEATLRPQDAGATTARYGRDPSHSEPSVDEFSFDGCWLPRNPALPGHGDVPCIYHHGGCGDDAEEPSTTTSSLTSAVLDTKSESHVIATSTDFSQVKLTPTSLGLR